MTDLTSNEGAGDVSAPSAKGTLLRVGLTTGQTLMVLTSEPAERDLDLMVIHSISGDRIEVRRDYITYVRGSEVDLPTDEEIAAYEAKLLLGDKSTTTANTGSYI